MNGETYVFFGIAGSGKGTQVKLLMGLLDKKGAGECVYAYPGNEYRHLIESGSFTGKIVQESFDKGHLQPDFLTNTIFTDILISHLSPEKNLIADGYPRTLAQAENFEQLMKFFKRDKIKIVYIQVGKDEATKRTLARGRTDDTPEGIAKRFDEYVNNVVPAMQYFDGKIGYQVHSINGEQPVEKVHEDIIKALNLE